MEKTIPRILSMMNGAAEGQPARLEEMGLEEGFSYQVPNKFNPEEASKEDLQEELTDLIFIAEAANRLHLDKFKEVTRKAITHMVHSFLTCYHKRPKSYPAYSGEDLAKELQEQTRVIFRSVEILKREEDLKTLGQPPSQDQKQDHKKDLDEASGSNYSPSQSESSTDEDDAGSETSKSSAKNKPNDQKSSSKRPRPTDPSSSSVSPSPKKRRTSSDEKSSSLPTPPAISGSSERVRSHHKKKQCPVPKCSFHGNDLRRHLQTHVRNNEIASGAVEKLLSIVRADAETHGKSQGRRGKEPVKGRQRKWCSVPGCNQVVLDMARHLENPTLHGFA